MDMQPGHGHAAWTRTGSLDTDSQLGHGQPAWTRTGSLDTGTLPSHGHAACTWTCSSGHELVMYIDMDIDMDIIYHINSKMKQSRVPPQV
jgi:nitric oxide reductase large subunit